MGNQATKQGMLKELQRQLNQELGAAHAYLALAAWCDDHNLNGFARWFSKQAAEERGHAEKFIRHLLDRQTMPRLSALPEPKSDFRDLLEVAKHALTMEQGNTAGINACYEAATRDADYPAQVLLHWFITEQVEEENWATEMAERVEHANCAGGIGDLDRHIERYLTEDGFSANDGVGEKT